MFMAIERNSGRENTKVVFGLDFPLQRFWFLRDCIIYFILHFFFSQWKFWAFPSVWRCLGVVVDRNVQINVKERSGVRFSVRVVMLIFFFSIFLKCFFVGSLPSFPSNGNTKNKKNARYSPLSIVSWRDEVAHSSAKHLYFYFCIPLLDKQPFACFGFAVNSILEKK